MTWEQDYRTSALTGLPPALLQPVVPLNFLSEVRTVFEFLPCSYGSTISSSVPEARRLPRSSPVPALAGRGSRGRGETTGKPKGSNMPEPFQSKCCLSPSARVQSPARPARLVSRLPRLRRRCCAGSVVGSRGRRGGQRSAGRWRVLGGPSRPRGSASWSGAKRPGGRCGGRGAGSLSYERRLRRGRAGGCVGNAGRRVGRLGLKPRDEEGGAESARRAGPPQPEGRVHSRGAGGTGAARGLGSLQGAPFGGGPEPLGRRHPRRPPARPAGR